MLPPKYRNGNRFIPFFEVSTSPKLVNTGWRRLIDSAEVGQEVVWEKVF